MQSMQTIGLLGGLSWESTVVYYRLINEQVRERRGGLHSAPLLLHSFDFAEIVHLQQSGAWTEAADTLAEAARGLCGAGARCVAICTNTMHCVADAVVDAVPEDIPLLHIADATGAAVRAAGIQRVALLGTRYTMEQPFLAERLERDFGLSVIVPDAEDREIVHRIIFSELCQGKVLPSSREALTEIGHRLQAQGAEAVILGCTELMLSIGTETGDYPLPRFDSTALHAQALADFALAAY